MSEFDDRDELFQPNGQIRLDIVTDSTLKAFEKALVHTIKTRWESVRTPHLFMGLLAAPDQAIVEWGNRLGANLGRLLDQFREIFFSENSSEATITVRLNREFLSDNVIRLLRDSWMRARNSGRLRISPMDLLVEIFASPNSIVAECFRRIGLSAEQLTELAIMAERDADLQ